MSKGKSLWTFVFGGLGLADTDARDLVDLATIGDAVSLLAETDLAPTTGRDLGIAARDVV